MDLTNKACIFDMDGTLINNMGWHAQAWQQLLTENGLPFDRDEFSRRTAGKINTEIIPEVFGAITAARLEELSNRKESLYRELYTPHRQPLAGAREFLAACQKLGVRLAVATSAPPANVEFILDGLDLRHFFQAVITAADITRGKPDPEIFLKAAAHLGVAPQNCLVFEDALNGLEAAHRAGMKVVGLATVNAPELMRGLPSVVAVHTDFGGLEPQDLLEQHLTSDGGIVENKSEAVGL